jgi:hypothetical protein
MWRLRRLDQFHAQLVAFGAELPTDLNDLEEADFDQIGMKRIHKTRLQRALEN